MRPALIVGASLLSSLPAVAWAQPQQYPPAASQQYPYATPQQYPSPAPQQYYPPAAPQQYPYPAPQQYPAPAPQQYPYAAPQQYPYAAPQQYPYAAPQQYYPYRGAAAPARPAAATESNVAWGARFRYVVVPKFVMNMFVDGGTTIGAPAFGPEIVLRSPKMETVFGLQYTAYSFDKVPFRSSSDPQTAWELVDLNLKVIYLTADFLWAADIGHKSSFLYGIGTGLGVVIGSMHRVQVTPVNPKNPGDPAQASSWKPCPTNAAGSGPPDLTDQYCDDLNQHYGDYKEPSWFNGGSKPALFPWLALQFGFGFDLGRKSELRLDFGWNLANGPFLGLALLFG